jgi:hypothetical protein
VNGLSATLANNVGSGQAIFFNGSLVGDFNPVTGLTITGTPFSYNPSLGNLLLEVIVTNQANVPNTGSNGYLDADTTGSLTSRAYDITNGSNVADGEGLVTVFNATSVPEPATWSLVGMALTGIGVLLRPRQR